MRRRHKLSTFKPVKMITRLYLTQGYWVWFTPNLLFRPNLRVSVIKTK